MELARGAHTWQVMDGGDTSSQRFLGDELGRVRPDDAVLSEEGLEDPRRFEIDRLLPTHPPPRHPRKYGEPGRIDWAVHVALWGRRRLRRPAPSACPHSVPCSRPIRRRPCRRSGASARGRHVPRGPRTPPPSSPTPSTPSPCASGSAGAKAMSVVDGETDIYVHDGGMYQWDSAAPAAVALAAGLHVSRIDGSPIVYNARDPWLPDFSSAARSGRDPSSPPCGTTSAIRSGPAHCAPRLATGTRAVHDIPRDGSAGHDTHRVADAPGVMELKATRYEVDGGVATVWLHRPHRHNAWTGRMHAEYRWMLAELAADERVRVVVLTGTPPAFCVGADSQALAGHAERGGYDDGLRGDLATPGYGVRPEFDHDFAFQFALPYVMIAAVNGAAAGIGLAIALFCDLRFVAATAKVTTAAPKLGLPAEFGMSWMLPRLVGVDPRRRPAAVGPRRHRRRDRRVGPVERGPRRR